MSWKTLCGLVDLYAHHKSPIGRAETSMEESTPRPRWWMESLLFWSSHLGSWTTFKVFFIFSISFLMLFKSSSLFRLGCIVCLELDRPVRLELDYSVHLELSSLLLVHGLWPSSSSLFWLHWQGGMLLFFWERRYLNFLFCLVNSSTLAASIWICWIICIGSSGVDDLGSIASFEW